MAPSESGSEVGQREDGTAAARRRERHRLDRLVRDVTLALLDEQTPERMQSALTDALAAGGEYSAVWVGNRLNRGPTARAGDDDLVEVLGEIALGPDEGEGDANGLVRPVPATTVQSVAANVGVDVPRTRAASVRLKSRGLACGVAVVATRREAAFDATERAALTDVGRVAGFALDAAVYQTLLVADGKIEVVLELDHGTTPTALTALADAYGSPVELTRLLPRPDGAQLRVAVDDPDTDPASVAGTPFVERGIVTEDNDGTATVDLVVTQSAPLATLATSGVAISRAVADANRMRVTVQGGETGLEILRSFRTKFPGVSCLAKRQVPTSDPGIHSEDLLERAGLTKKQETVLEVALAGGFFDRPRRKTGQELADELGVSDSTFHQHLRDGVRKVVRTVIDN